MDIVALSMMLNKQQLMQSVSLAITKQVSD